MRGRRFLGFPWLLMLLGGAGCEPDLDLTRSVPVRGTFGEVVYLESCERVAWTSQLDEQAAGSRTVLDVNGSVYGPVCTMDALAPMDAPRRLTALQAQRGNIVRVVDLVLPMDFLSSLESFLEAIKVLDDDGTMEATIASVGSVLRSMSDDAGFAPALARMSARRGFVPRSSSTGLARSVLGWSGVDDLLRGLLGLLLDASGHSTPELDALLGAGSRELSSSVALVAPGDPGRTLRVALDLLMMPARNVASGTALPLVLRDARGVPAITADPRGGVPAPFVDKNGDGLADIDVHDRFVGADGLALAIGAPFLPPGGTDPKTAQRDPAGRLLGAGGRLVYRYVDLDGTVLAGLMREQSTLADPAKDDLIGLLHGASALLGPRASRTRAYKDSTGSSSTLTYNGFAVESGALLDLFHAYVQVLGTPHIRDLLTGVSTLLDKYEDPTARALGAMLDVSNRGKLAMSAQVPEASTLFDELVPLISRIAGVPGLVDDLLDALSDKHVLGLAPMLARQLLDKDRFTLNQDTQQSSGSFGTPVDRGSPDVDWNRSVMQRMVHLVHDANNVEFCNKQGAQVKVLGLPLATYDKCKMFRIDDLGLFFALTIADTSIVDDKTRPDTRNMASFREHLQDSTMKFLIGDNGSGDTLIQGLTGITGFTRFPTPMAAARSLFLDTQHQSDFMRNATDPVACSDGDRFIDTHGDSIFAWEATLPSNPSGFARDTFYDAVRPLINAFAKHDECVTVDAGNACTKRRNAVKIFVDLLSVLHEHWGSPLSAYGGHAYQSANRGAARFSTGDKLVSYEPLLGEVFAVSDLVPSIIALAPILSTTTTDGAGGPRLRPILIEAIRYLFDPSVTPASVAYRDGRTSTTWSDGKTVVQRATPYYLLADAYAAKRAALAATSPDRAGSWRAATSDLVDELLTVSVSAGGAHQLKNRRMHGVTLALIAFLQARIDAHVVAADLSPWVHKTLTGNLTDVVAGPTMAAIVDLAAKLESDPATLTGLYRLISRLADESPAGAFPVALTSVADTLQLLLDDTNLVPVAHALGAVLAPERLLPSLVLMKRARDLDPRQPSGSMHSTLITVLANFFQDVPAGSGVTPMSDLGDALSEVNRAAPGSGGDLEAVDYRVGLDQIRGFLTDEQRGFMKFVRIVQSRSAPAN